MARRKSSEYRSEATRDPFELELDTTHPDGAPIVVTFTNPNDFEAGNAFDLALEEDPKAALRALLVPVLPAGSDEDAPEDTSQWRPFWDEWRRRRVGDLNALLDDVMKHYGAERGKLSRSSR